MYIITDDENFITTASWGGILEDGFKVDDFEFEEEILAYQYLNDEIVLNEDQLMKIKKLQKVEIEIIELQNFLDETQSVVTQAFEEEILGIETNQDDIKQIVKKRHKTKTRILELQKEVEEYGKGY